MATPYSVDDVFHYLDSVGDKKIAVRQIGDCLRAMGLSPTEAEINRLTAHWSEKGEEKLIRDNREKSPETVYGGCVWPYHLSHSSPAQDYKTLPRLSVIGLCPPA